MPLQASPTPLAMNALNSVPSGGPAYLIFYSNIVDGQMWCPDCRKVESTVAKAFEGPGSPRGVIFWVGERAEWRTPSNPARAQWNVNAVPTILRLEGGKETARIVEDDILDEAKFKAFLA